MDRLGDRPGPNVPDAPLGVRGLVAVNGRFLADRMTGVQRYAFELTRALVGALAQYGRRLVVLAPGGSLDARASQLPVVAGGPEPPSAPRGAPARPRHDPPPGRG